MANTDPRKHRIIGEKELNRNLKELNRVLDDMTPQLTSVADSWLLMNKELFRLKGKGKYTDYKGDRKNGMTAYMRWKTQNAIQRSPYPMLKAKNGRIEDGLTDKHSIHTVRIISKHNLIMGIKNVSGALFHQKGGEIIPQRTVVFNKPKHGERYYRQNRRFNNVITESLKRRIGGIGRPA